jgi:hypothetical protein
MHRQVWDVQLEPEDGAALEGEARHCDQRQAVARTSGIQHQTNQNGYGLQTDLILHGMHKSVENVRGRRPPHRLDVPESRVEEMQFLGEAMRAHTARPKRGRQVCRDESEPSGLGKCALSCVSRGPSFGAVSHADGASDTQMPREDTTFHLQCQE